MRGKSRVLAFLILGILCPASSARAMCIPFFCEDCDLKSNGQLNWVVMDRERGMVEFIPNIRITGSAEDFALLVPTPSDPIFQPEVKTVWDEAFALTAAVSASGGDGGFGCGSETVAVPAGPETTDGVDIVRTETVGNFVATVIRSDDPGALVAWLNRNNFTIAPEEADRFAPFIEAGWFFTAMKLDTDAVVPPPSWDTNVDPVRVVFEADELEVPLSILSIHRSGFFPMSFFVVDDHRTELKGFNTVYANRISQGEANMIAGLYPGLAPDLTPGRYLTRLDRNFGPEDVLSDLMLERAPSDTEFRRINRTSVWGSFPLAALAIMSMLLLARPGLYRRS